MKREKNRIIETKKLSLKGFKREYLKNIGSLIDVSSKTELNLLFAIWERSNYNKDQVILIKNAKEEIAKEIGIKYDHVCNLVASLSKKKILQRVATGIYILNPDYFFKNNELSKIKNIELLFKYEINHK